MKKLASLLKGRERVRPGTVNERKGRLSVNGRGTTSETLRATDYPNFLKSLLARGRASARLFFCFGKDRKVSEQHEGGIVVKRKRRSMQRSSSGWGREAGNTADEHAPA